MQKFLKKTIKSIKDPSRSFKERVFIMFTIISCAVALMALIGDIVLGENKIEIAALTFTVLVVPAITLISVKKNTVQLATRLIVVVLIFVLLPIIFYGGGGIEGGGVHWIVFAYLYTGLVLSGKWRFVIMGILTLETVFFYISQLYVPGTVIKHNREMFVRDSMISIILVGVVCCLMVWFEEWLFDVENKRAVDEARKFEELNQSQGRFFSNMSHEIRTPINTILGLNELILRQEDVSEEIKRDAVNIRGAGSMLLSLVNDILDISKIEAGKMDIVPVDYSLGDMISEIVNMMWLPTEEKGLKLFVEVDPSLPEGLYGDEVRIKQILINLLNNAVKYTSEGSVTLHIDEEDIIDDRVRIMYSVTDTGMGIKQDALPHLFDAFLRADEEKNARIEGTGLGLSIVKQLVDLMGGNITVDSVYTEGSTFMVSLWQKISDPKALGEISISNPDLNVGGEKFETGFFAPEARILIVDDNEMNLEVEKKLIEDTRIIIDTARSGQMALDMTMINRYDVILMDHLMPQMDGIECMQKIRKQTGGLNNHVPVIVLTANAGGENKKLYAKSGFDGYLVKPVTGRQLEETLIAHLPESKVMISRDSDFFREEMNTSADYSRKISLVITTSTMCDLPGELFDEYGIDTIPFRIHADDKVYFDTMEASTDELIRYMKNGMDIRSEAPSVEEFERFFGNELKKAHQVLYISLMSAVSDEYERAKEASRAYGNVTVYNSEFNASSIGIMVLIAHHMASQGKNAWEIVHYLNSLKEKMFCSFVTTDTEMMMRRGFISRGTHNFLKTLSVRPIIRIKNNTFKVGRLAVGDIDSCYKKYIRYALPKHGHPDKDVLFVPYVDLSDDKIEAIRADIKKRVDFKRILFLQASAVSSLNCGLGAFGLLYIEEGEEPYGLDELLSILDEDDIPGIDDYYEEYEIESEIEPEPEKEPEPIDLPLPEADDDSWCEGLTGLDIEKGLENSGTMDLYKTVLKMFYESIPEKTRELEELFNDENWNDYIIKVHALKASARIVGATELGISAEAMEFAAKSGDRSYIRANHADLMSEYNCYTDTLKSVFKES